MFILPLLAMQSRETNRLPVKQVRDLLKCGAWLPLELQITHENIPPSGQFALILFSNDEFGADSQKDNFLLVEISDGGDGCEYTVLDKGSIEGSYVCEEEEIKFSIKFTGICKKIGRYRFYCKYFSEFEKKYKVTVPSQS